MPDLPFPQFVILNDVKNLFCGNVAGDAGMRQGPSATRVSVWGVDFRLVRRERFFALLRMTMRGGVAFERPRMGRTLLAIFPIGRSLLDELRPFPGDLVQRVLR